MPPKPRHAFAVWLLLLGMGSVLSGPAGCARAPRRASAVEPVRGGAARPEARVDAARPAARVEVKEYPFTSGERAAVDEFLR
ncbi:MAG TPA: hypothetical protein VIZ58_11520, partial [Thermoanaerobaculia bacterium]